MYAADVIVTYQVLPEKSAWLYANVSDIKNLVGDELVASAIKSAMAELGPNEVNNRTKIEPLAQQKLAENAEQPAKGGYEHAPVAKLIDTVQDPIPHCMFEQRADSMMDAFANQLKGQNVDLDLYLQYTGMTKDQLKETYLERAENEVKLRLALEKIAELEGLEVADEELDAELTKLAEQYNMTLDDVKARIPVAEYKLDMLVTKALDLVKDSAVVDNSEPAEAEKAEDKEAE